MTADNVSLALRNLGTALDRLGEALQEPDTGSLVIDGTIHRFEVVIGLYWETLKCFLAAQGIQTHTPRETFRHAYRAQWISDEAPWLQMLDDRNVSPQVCDETTARRIYANIKAYYPEMERTHQFLKQRFRNGP